jgi:hypothetical protein
MHTDNLNTEIEFVYLFLRENLLFVDVDYWQQFDEWVMLMY